MLASPPAANSPNKPDATSPEVIQFIKDFDEALNDFHRKLYDLKKDFMKRLSEMRKQSDLRRAQEVLTSIRSPHA